jgi:hypothetical protein
MIQSLLPLHECATEPLQDIESVTDPGAAESVVEPLHAVANLAATGAALTETSCLCVRVRTLIIT